MAKKMTGKPEPMDEETVETQAFRDGYYAASVTVEEVLQAVRVDIENAGLGEAANTAAKLAVEMVSRLWYERKEGK